MPSREADLYKDRVEVSLDGRQIFYLFFGGAVIVGLVFVLGVMVGRRVEARGHVDRARTTAVVDPLAALDRLESSAGLSFQGALTGTPGQSDVEREIAELEKARAGKPDAKSDVKPSKAEPKAEPAKPEAKAAKPEPKVEAKPDEKTAKADAKPTVKTEVKSDKPEAKSESSAEAKSDSKSEKAEAKSDKPKSDKVESKSDKPKPDDGKAAAKPASETAEARADKPKADGDSEKKQKFTLQLSSFQDRQEAEAFLSSIKASGYQAYMTEASVGGKGTFYRVRLGTYRSIEAANDAKADFEKRSHQSASVMRL